MTRKAATEDIANRYPVWVALSELFLDTELQSDDFERLGRALVSSPYTSDEIEQIFYGEVYPICIWNLRSVAGEWAGFDSDGLQQAILNNPRGWFRIPRILHAGHWRVRDSWRRIKDAMEECRTEACAPDAEPGVPPDSGGSR